MVASARIRSIDMEIIDDVFDMGGGYVLDFSNASFNNFFLEEVGVNIYDGKYEVDGTSKAKRLRCYLRLASPTQAAKALEKLWEYREFKRKRSELKETIPNAERDLAEIVSKLGGKIPITEKRPSNSTPISSTISSSVFAELRSDLLALSKLQPQARGYEFERFLKKLFDENGLSGRSSFKVRGEQIDGSFQLDSETYLLEAKWTADRVDASGLRSFNGKVEEKVAWSRGLLISDSGFTEDGLFAFGRGKRIICMDGLDLNDMLEREISFSEVMSRKVRRAVETGMLHVRVRELF